MTQDKSIHSNYQDSAFRLGGAVWKRRRWLAVLAFVAPFAAAVSLIAAMPNLYRAKATVLVRQEQVADPAAATGAAVELEARLQLISEQILSRARLEELIERFDLYPALRKKQASSEQLIERMRRDIRLERKQVESRNGDGATVAFTLTFEGWDPQVTAQVANALAAFYVQENEQLRRRQADAPRGVDLLTQMQQDLMELRMRFNENYPDIVQLKAEIAALTRLRQQEARAAAGQPGAQTDAELAEQREHVLSETSASPSVRAAAARAAEAPKEQFLILDSAIAPVMPAAPNRIRLLFMALVLALGIAGVSVLLAEQLDTSFHRRDDLWGFANMPILASIPRIVTRADIWLRRLRFGLLGVLTVGGMALLVRASWFIGQNGDQLVWMLAQRGS
jgi:uncharacterized protein involved in exopolysaccharide biosynthesis